MEREIPVPLPAGDGGGGFVSSRLLVFSVLVRVYDIS